MGDMARRAGALSPAREIPGPFRPAPRIVARPPVRPR
ncbi:MAG: hypothetical protein QOD55_1078, partial [Solirubrobacteraceae bacterium]|nr:hypothetical protein [Solirubrobacteraceae bacterium]